MLVNFAQGLTKSYGERLPSCGTGQVREELAKQLSAPSQRHWGRCWQNQRGEERYPEVELLKQVHAVGTQPR